MFSAACWNVVLTDEPAALKTSRHKHTETWLTNLDITVKIRNKNTSRWIESWEKRETDRRMENYTKTRKSFCPSDCETETGLSWIWRKCPNMKQCKMSCEDIKWWRRCWKSPGFIEVALDVFIWLFSLVYFLLFCGVCGVCVCVCVNSCTCVKGFP